ncbi:MAG: 50S ribosomal protein L23 [Planctomycetes bacterium]|nr:50S ribosomal protein L23 [Planctomycetota bacterium]
MDMHEIIKGPLHTEKSVEDIRTNNQYHFEVDQRASKKQIHRAVEHLFPDVKVVSVNTLKIPGKSRRRGWMRGKTPDRKKAIVKIRPGDTIDIGY